MRVVHVISNLEIGGAEKALQRLITSSRQEVDGISHTVVSLTSTGEIGRDLLNNGVEVVALGGRSFFGAPIKVMKLVAVMWRIKPDVVHTWMYHADLIGGVVARLLRIRLVVWGVRNSDIFYGKGLSKSAALSMKLCAFLSPVIPHKVIYVAEKARDKHVLMGYRPKKALVIGNGFEAKTQASPAERESARRMLSIPVDAVVVGSVGRFNEYKDQRCFIDAAAITLRDEPNLLFVMCGRDISWSNAQLAEWIHKNGLEGKFHLLGELKSTREVYQSLDIFCLHSRSEGFPNVLGEAMSYGVPCIATNVGDVSRILGSAGVIISSSSPTELAKGMLQLVKKNASERKDLGSKGLRRIDELFAQQLTYRKYLEVYRTGGIV